MAMNELSIQAQGVRHAIHTVFKSAAERVMPIRSASGFRTKGVWYMWTVLTIISCS